MTAITALTAQNTKGVLSIIKIKPSEISNQIEYTCKDIKPEVIKIGMLHSSKVIEAVCKSLNKIEEKKIMLDPVMVTTSKVKLISDSAINTLKNEMIVYQIIQIAFLSLIYFIFGLQILLYFICCSIFCFLLL